MRMTVIEHAYLSLRTRKATLIGRFMTIYDLSGSVSQKAALKQVKKWEVAEILLLTWNFTRMKGYKTRMGAKFASGSHSTR